MTSAEPAPRPRREPHRYSIRIFSSASDAPRARRPSDVVLLLLSVAGISLCLVPAPDPTALDEAVALLLAQIPASFGGLWQIAYDLLGLWPLVLLALTVFAHARLRIARDILIALGAAIVFLWLAASQMDVDAVSMLGDGTSVDQLGYVATRLAVATAVIATASPHLALPLRRVGRWVIVAGAIAGAALGVATSVGSVMGLLLGLAGAATAHLLTGSPGGRLTIREVADALDDLGVTLTDLTEEPLDRRGVAVVRGRDAAGRPVRVRIFGRDARQGQLIASTWSSLRRRGEMPKLGSGWHQVQHEAFVSLFAQRAGVPVLPVVAVGLAVEGDALLVLDADATALSDVTAERLSDDTVASLWSAFLTMGAAGVAMGSVTPAGLFVRSDGVGAVGDFADGGVGVGRSDLDTDRAQLLIVTALAIGRDRAIDIAVRTMGSETLESALPYLQPAVLEPGVARALKQEGWDLEELRVQVEQRTGSAPRDLEQLSRVTWGSIGKIALIGFATYAIVSALSDIGFESLIQEFKTAEKAWLVAALVMSPFVAFPQAVSTRSATSIEIRYGPVVLLQWAIQFIQLAVPSTAARVALQVRFFERVGVGAAPALAIGMIDGVSSFVVQLTLLFVITVSGLASLELFGSSSADGGAGNPISWDVLFVAVALLAVALVIALLVPRFRSLVRRFIDGVRHGAAGARDALRVLRSPRKIGGLFGGNLAAQLWFALILGCCLQAFGESASFAELILIYVFVSMFAGFMPVPGGVGVAEAAFTAAFIAIGIPDATAASAALLFRVVTFYLPPVWGSVAIRRLRAERYL